MNITEEAKNVLTEAMNEQKAENIRFYFAGQGCCGPQMGLSMDAPEESDQVETINEIQVAMDSRVVDMVKEVTLDHQDGGLVLAGLPEQNC
ncbi:adhesin [Halobacillus campisalis]|uniref:Adhesin n=1 Tax=Halobacillus campisalis TaxID=435909 RepID=A0ABW2K092_9BACI|nr:adhesin [Halobacillus campisalis]